MTVQSGSRVRTRVFAEFRALTGARPMRPTIGLPPGMLALQAQPTAEPPEALAMPAVFGR